MTPPAPRPPPHRRAKPEQPNPVPPAPPQPRPALTSRRRSRTARAEGGRTRQRGWGPGGPRGQRRSIAAAIGASGSAESGGRRRSQRETKPAPPAGKAPGEAAPRRGGASAFPRPASVAPGATGSVPRERAPCMDGLESPSEKSALGLGIRSARPPGRKGSHSHELPWRNAGGRQKKIIK